MRTEMRTFLLYLIIFGVALTALSAVAGVLYSSYLALTTNIGFVASLLATKYLWLLYVIGGFIALGAAWYEDYLAQKDYRD